MSYCVCLFYYVNCFFFFKQKTAYEMRISDWSSDVCSSDLTLLSFSSAVEVLRMANHLSGKPIYRWSILHPTQSSIVSSNGIAIGTQPLNEIGRASCRERVCQYV